MPVSIADPVHLAPPRSTYIHIPFCAHRCGYCDFTLVAGKDHLIENFLRALDFELAAIGDEPIELDTLYFGGGTPTHLAPDQLQRLFELVRSRFHMAPAGELTVEANPLDLTSERIDALAAAGVNRVSLGVQSFDPDILRVLERDHCAEDVLRGIERLRPRIANISLDLIFGVPGQTRELWRETLQHAFALEPTHLSTYGLTFEQGTAFWTRRAKGELRPVAEELECDLYAETMDLCEAAGFEQYEVSSFARSGFRSRHNQVYWSGRPYFAFGPGAASYLTGVRRHNHRSVTTWLKRVLAGESGVADSEALNDEDRARERFVLGLRTCDGIDEATFAAQTGWTCRELAGPALDRFVRLGLVERTAGTVRLTREGRFVCDAIVAELL